MRIISHILLSMAAFCLLCGALARERPTASPPGKCHQLKTIDGLFYAKTVEMQPQLVGAGLCSARQNAVNSFENLRRIRKQLPLWM